MKHIRYILGIALILIVAVALVVTHNTPASNLEVSVLLPLSGDTAFIGEDMKRGLDLAFKKSDISLDGQTINLIYEDSKGNAKDIISGYQKLASTHDPDVIIAGGSGVEALIPLAEQAKIPLILTVSSASNLPQQGEYIFRYFTNADNDVPVIARYATGELGYKKFGVIHIQDQFGIDYADIFSKSVSEEGGEVVVKEVYTYSDFDFKTQIAKISSRDVDALYLIGLDYQLIPLITQIREAGIITPILSTGTIATKDALSKIGLHAEGIHLTAFCTDGSPTEYVEMFQEEYGSYPGFFSEIGYDIGRMIRIAVAQDGASGAGIKDGLPEVQNFEGNTGVISSDEYGEMIIPMCVKRIEEGKIFNLATGRYSEY